MKKYPGADLSVRSIVQQEVNNFCQSEFVTKETIKQLETRVSLLLTQNLNENVSSFRNDNDTANKGGKKGGLMSQEIIMTKNGSAIKGNNYDQYTG